MCIYVLVSNDVLNARNIQMDKTEKKNCHTELQICFFFERFLFERQQNKSEFLKWQQQQQTDQNWMKIMDDEQINS